MSKLLPAIELKDLPEDFIIKLNDNFRKEFFEGMVKNCSYKELSRKIGVSTSFMYHLKNGRHNPRIKMLKLMCQNDPIKIIQIQNNIEQIISNRGARISLKMPFEANAKLAVLVGHCFGDGNISTKKRQFDYVNKDQVLITQVKQIVRELFDCDPISDLKQKDGTFKVTFSTLIGELLVLFGAPKGQKVVQVTKIPAWISKGNASIKKAFLSAIFDDDGSVLYTDKYPSKNVNLHFTRLKVLDPDTKEMFQEINEMLMSFDIKANVPYIARRYFVNGVERTVMGIFISKKEEMRKFNELIGFSQIEKNSRLIKCLNKRGGLIMRSTEQIKKALVIGSGPIVIGQAAEIAK